MFHARLADNDDSIPGLYDTSCSVRRGREGGSTMLCQYLAVFGRDDHDDDAICSGQKLKGGREGAGGERGREGGTARTDRSSSI